MTELTPREQTLLSEVRGALSHAKGPVREVEVGLELSILLGKLRPAVSCGGCSSPLEIDGVPARTVVGLKVPFHLVSASASGGGA